VISKRTPPHRQLPRNAVNLTSYREFSRRSSALGVQGLAADLNRFCVDQDNGDDTGRGAAIDPIVNRAAPPIF
jgi:hypothetical protein